eukprot:s378_g43.t1
MARASGPRLRLSSVLAALQLFGYLEPRAGRTCIRWWIQSGTDDRSIDFLSKKSSTTRWLTLVNMQFSHCLMRAGGSLSWRPRDENTLADDLTNFRDEYLDHDSWAVYGRGRLKPEKTEWD